MFNKKEHFDLKWGASIHEIPIIVCFVYLSIISDLLESDRICSCSRNLYISQCPRAKGYMFRIQ